MSPVKLSIVVCTYNRAAKLPDCLQGLLAMKVPEGVTWELVCVDNNSTDNTKQVIEDFGRRSSIPIRYVFEKQQGSSHAKNAGLRLAAGEIVAMTDDDCIADPDWLAAIRREFQADSALDFLGGRVELHNKDDMPISIRTSRERVDFTPSALFGLIPGCNMAFRRRVIGETGLFDPDFGAGARIPSAEDAEFVYRAYKADFKIVYVPDVLIYHDHGRRTEGEREKLMRLYLIGRGAFYMKYMLRGDGRVLRMAYWESYNLLKDFLKNAAKGRWDGKALQLLGHLMRGAVLYLWVRMRAAILPRR